MGLVSPGNAAAPGAGTYISTPDTIVAAADLKSDVERGLLFVPENRREPKSRSIAVHFLRFPALQARPGRAAVFLLPGGPGYEADFENPRGPYSLRSVERLRRTRDVIYVSQRGNPKAPGLVPDLSADVLNRANLKEALSTWTSRGVDLRGYDIVNIVDDVHELRQALGYDKIVLVGCSFGSQWSLAYLKRWPETVDRALLSGLEPLDYAYDSPKWLWAALSRLAQRAEADPALAAEIPKGGLLNALTQVIEQLERKPRIVTIQDPRTRQSIPVTLGAQDVRALIADRGAFGRTPAEALGNWPLFILEMSRGDLRFVAAKTWQTRRAQEEGDPLIGLLIDNSLGITAKRDAALLAEPEARWLGDINAIYRATRDLTPTPDVGDAFRADWKIDVPTLLIHGDVDWSTPLENSRHLLRYLEHGRLIEVQGGTHCDENPVMADERPRDLERIYSFIDADFGTTTPETFFATLPKSVAYPAIRFATPSGRSLYEQWVAGL